MSVTDMTGGEQTTLWNGAAGRAWVQTQDLLDEVFRPFEELLVDAIRAESANRVLDVGCGAGSTTVAAARALGAGSQCVGIDISEPMIAAARARAERTGAPVSFLQVDAENHAFEPGSFDRIISRFGVMFFQDSVRAFANLRRAANDNGKLQFLAWRSSDENPFMTTAERAARPLLPNLPVRKPDAPGQFAFADPARVRSILEESGWSEIDVQPVDVACTLPEEQLGEYVGRLGPVGLALQAVDEATRAAVIAKVRPAFDRYVHGSDVRFTAACWLVGARNHASL